MPHVRVWLQALSGRHNLFLQWHDPETGQRRTKATDVPAVEAAQTKADRVRAEKLRGDLEYELNHGKRPGSPQMTWATFREMYEAEVLAGQRASTREKAGAVFDVLEAEINPSKLVNLNERTLSRFVAKLRQRKGGLAPITIRNYLVCLKAALGWAAAQKMIGAVPTFPTVKVPKKKPQPVSEKEFEMLLGAAPDATWRAYFLCGWWGGLRLSEARHLRRKPNDEWPWLDLDGARIVLPAAFAKSCEDQWVPLHSTLRTALEAIQSDKDRVFDNLRGPSGLLMSRHAITNKIARIAKRARVRLSMHRLRKGFGCRVAVQLGRGNAPVLHRLMRHSSMQVTMEFYANCDDALQDAMKALR